MLAFTIYLPPVTKKNSQRIVMRGRYPKLLPSKAYMDYEKKCEPFMPDCETICNRVNVRTTFFMKTRRKVDLCNLQEAICDVLVHYKVIEDDNASIVVSMDGSRVMYDKDNPRTEVVIEEVI